MSPRPTDPTPSVQIVEVAPRDGLQNEAARLDTATKVQLINAAVDAGARRIEATSFVHPRRVPQMADAEAVMDAVPRRAGVAYIGLALNLQGVERALSARCDEINLVVVASETFNQRNQGTSSDATLAMIEEATGTIHAAGARVSVTVAASFGCPFEGEVPTGRVVELARRVVAAGCDELALADTIGVAVPRDIHQRVEAVRGAVGGVSFRLHLHDTRHTGIANAQAAIDAGVDVLDAALGGIGGCPFAPAATGNIATEDLLYLLDRSGIAHGWSTPAAIEIVSWLEKRLGHALPGMLARAGAFPPSVPIA